MTDDPPAWFVKHWMKISMGLMSLVVSVLLGLVGWVAIDMRDSFRTGLSDFKTEVGTQFKTTNETLQALTKEVAGNTVALEAQSRLEARLIDHLNDDSIHRAGLAPIEHEVELLWEEVRDLQDWKDSQ